MTKEHLKSSEDWYKELYHNQEVIILDPDGWDRKNYDYSFKEEKIDKEEFERRLGLSTVMANDKKGE